MSDDLLPAIAAGDAEAFAAWLAGAEPRVRASLRRFAADVDTEAVLQEALLRVWQVAPRFVPDGKPDGLIRLAVRVARNLAVSELRRFRVPPARAEDLARAAENDPVPPVEPDPLLRAAIARCRARLPKQPALALAQRLLDGGGRPDRELAEQAGMKLNTFLQNIRRARLLLRDCLEKQGIRLAEVAR